MSVFDVTAHIGLSTIFHKTNYFLCVYFPAIFFNFRNVQYINIISAILLKVKVKEVFSHRKQRSESLWATLYFTCQFSILEITPNSNQSWKGIGNVYVLFCYFCLLASYPHQSGTNIWRQTQTFIVLA